MRKTAKRKQTSRCAASPVFEVRVACRNESGLSKPVVLSERTVNSGNPVFQEGKLSNEGQWSSSQTAGEDVLDLSPNASFVWVFQLESTEDFA